MKEIENPELQRIISEARSTDSYKSFEQQDKLIEELCRLDIDKLISLKEFADTWFETRKSGFFSNSVSQPLCDNFWRTVIQVHDSKIKIRSFEVFWETAQNFKLSKTINIPTEWDDDTENYIITKRAKELIDLAKLELMKQKIECKTYRTSQS